MLSKIKNVFTLPSRKPRVLLPKEEESTLIDVRTPEEFNAGHNATAINIPLDSIESHINDFRHSGKKIVLVCRSGARSGRATEWLRASGIEAFNGGAWDNFSFN